MGGGWDGILHLLFLYHCVFEPIVGLGLGLVGLSMKGKM